MNISEGEAIVPSNASSDWCSARPSRALLPNVCSSILRNYCFFSGRMPQMRHIQSQVRRRCHRRRATAPTSLSVSTPLEHEAVRRGFRSRARLYQFL